MTTSRRKPSLRVTIPGMNPMGTTGNDRDRLGDYIHAARLAHYGSVEKAIRAAGVNRATWLRAERGAPIRDESMTAIEKALGWNVGDSDRIMAGGEPMDEPAEPAGADELRSLIERADYMTGREKRAMLALLATFEHDDDEHPMRTDRTGDIRDVG